MCTFSRTFLCLALLATLPIGNSQAQHMLETTARPEAHPAAPVFEEVPCDLPGATPAALERLRCGMVAVPRFHEDPSRGEYRLRVVILPAEQQPAPRPDAVLVLPGGPGGTSIPQVSASVGSVPLPLARERDIVFIDVRGAGGSEPSICREGAFQRWRELFAADLTIDQMVAASSAMTESCFEEARARGHSPLSFGSRVDADDIELVRRALGAPPWNVVGVSYGAVTAMTLASRHPDAVRTLVLDSPSLGAQDPWDRRQGWKAAGQTLWAACAADLACQHDYPDLSGEYQQAINLLEQYPLTVTGPDGAAILNRGDLEFGVYGSLYLNTMTAFAPALIRGVTEGRSQPFAESYAALMAETSWFSFAATVCRDQPPDANWRVATSANPRHAAEVVAPGPACGEWVEPDPAPEVPRDTAIPTLVLSGMFDPVTPPAFGRLAASLVGPAARHVTFPAVGHAVVRQSLCAQAVALGFLDNPAASLQTACVVETPPLEFALPESEAGATAAD